MKTIRTIIATLSGVLLTFALVAWISVRRNAAFIQRTIYQGFDQTFVVALVMGCAFLLIATILTVAIVSTDEDEEDEEEEELVRPKRRPRSQTTPDRGSAALKGEQPYRRVPRTRTQEERKTSRWEEDSGFARPKAKTEDRSAPKKRERAAERPDEIALRREELPVKKKKAPKIDPEPVIELPEEPAETVETAMEIPQPAAEAEIPAAEAETEAPAAEPQEEASAVIVEAEPAAEPEGTGIEAPETVEEAPEEPGEALKSAPGSAEEERAAEPHREEDQVRCIFCGNAISRDSLFCPYCGKKR